MPSLFPGVTMVPQVGQQWYHRLGCDMIYTKSIQAFAERVHDSGYDNFCSDTMTSAPAQLHVPLKSPLTVILSTGRTILYLQLMNKLTSQCEIRTLWTKLTTTNWSSEIDQIHLSIEAQCGTTLLPLDDCHSTYRTLIQSEYKDPFSVRQLLPLPSFLKVSSAPCSHCPCQVHSDSWSIKVLTYLPAISTICFYYKLPILRPPSAFTSSLMGLLNTWCGYAIIFIWINVDKMVCKEGKLFVFF